MWPSRTRVFPCWNEESTQLLTIFGLKKKKNHTIIILFSWLQLLSFIKVPPSSQRLFAGSKSGMSSPIPATLTSNLEDLHELVQFCLNGARTKLDNIKHT